MKKLLLILLLIVGVSAIDTDVDNAVDGMIYFTNGDYKKCVHTTSISEGFTLENAFLKPYLLAKCDEITWEVKLVDKIVPATNLGIAVNMFQFEKYFPMSVIVTFDIYALLIPKSYSETDGILTFDDLQIKFLPGFVFGFQTPLLK